MQIKGFRRSRKHVRTSRFGVEPLEARVVLSAVASAYDMGTPTLIDVWVDPQAGSDSNSGASRGQALHSLGEAWDRIPSGTPLSAGYHIHLAAGDYSAALLPSNGWTSDRVGTYAAPIWIDASDGPLGARLHGALNLQNDSYVYLQGLDFVTDRGASGGGNVLQIASDDHILVRSCRLNGNDGSTNTAQETFKGNQCQYVYVESSDFGGAFWFGLDFVAVEYGHIINSRIHDTGDDGLVLKGGTAQFDVMGNTIERIGNIGFAAGQGAGFEFMVAPWLHYEAYDLKFVDNVIRDVQNAGMAVRGGYDILLADNTLYRVGQSQGSGASMLLFSPGGRTCDGDAAACAIRHAEGGWGPTQPGQGGEWIPNKNVYVYDNVLDNPAGSATMWETVSVFGPRSVPADSNIPSPVRSDDNLVIRGNILWNGAPDHNLGPTDPATDARWRADNAVGTIEPQFVDAVGGDFTPLPGGNLAGLSSLAIPGFTGGDLPLRPPAPQGDLSNLVSADARNNPRSDASPPGAFVSADSSQPGPPSPPPAPVPIPGPAPPPVSISPPTPVAPPVVHGRSPKQHTPKPPKFHVPKPPSAHHHKPSRHR